MRLSIIIPVYNEAAIIGESLQNLMAVLKPWGQDVEVIVADGQSTDDTVALANAFDVTVLSAPKGRANQMNLGAQIAQGEYLLFLHIDTRLPNHFLPKVSGEWGFFRLRLSGQRRCFRMIEAAINLRTKLTSIASGDQCLFVKKSLFDELGGYRPIPLMEDIALSRALKKRAKPVIIHSPVISSSRRWEEGGVFKTIWLMWRLRLSYYCGVSPEKLRRYYV